VRSGAGAELRAMPKRRRNVPLALRLLWRRLRSPDGRLAPLAALSIAVSVALATGLEMSSRSAQEQLKETAAAIGGAAKIQIVAGSVGVPEEVLDQARDLAGVAIATPLITAKLRVVDYQVPINVVGVDLLVERQVRRTSILSEGLRVRDPLLLMAQTNAIVVTPELLERLDLLSSWNSGTEVKLDVIIAGIRHRLIVQGLLDRGGIASAFGGQLAVMDVYSLQNLLGRDGWFDRIDVVPAEGVSVPQLASALSEQLRGKATVRTATGDTQGLSDSIQMIQMTALLLACAGGIAAALVSYATASQWVERQESQLRILRAVGMEARRIQIGTLVEISLLGTVSCALGLAGGIVLSPRMLSALSRLAASAKEERFTTLSIEASTLGVALLVGVVAPLLGSALPILRSGRRFTYDSTEGGTRAASDRRWRMSGTALATLFILALLARPTWTPGGAIVRVAVVFIAGLGAIFSFAPTILSASHRLLAPVRGCSPALGHLAARALLARPLNFSVAVTAIASLVAVLVSVFLVTSTMMTSAERWTLARYPNATVVMAGTLLDLSGVDLLSPATIEAIRSAKGVRAVDEVYRNEATVLFRGKEVQLDAHNMDVVAQYGHIVSIGRDSSEVARSISAGGVAVSTTFSRSFGLGVGDSFELDTPTGTKTFNIVGLVEDYSGPVGSIMLDLGTFDAHWKRAGAWSALVWTEGSREQVVDEIRRRVGDSQDLYFADATQIAKANRQTAALFNDVLVTIASFMEALGGVAVSILMLGAVAERRRDLALLRAAGAEPRTLLCLVVADAALVCLIASVLGLSLGLLCASPATDVLREAYGWVLEQRWSSRELPLLATGTMVLGLLGATLPARMAYRAIPADAFAPE